MVNAENLAGGFSGLYPVLKAMEETGRVRRGYFVHGLGAAQFCAPGADDRLREKAGSRYTMGPGSTVVTLAATDPANPYGQALYLGQIAQTTKRDAPRERPEHKSFCLPVV